MPKRKSTRRQPPSPPLEKGKKKMKVDIDSGDDDFVDEPGKMVRKGEASSSKGKTKQPVKAKKKTGKKVMERANSDDLAEEPTFIDDGEDFDEDAEFDPGQKALVPKGKVREITDDCKFIGGVIPEKQAREMWPHRFNIKPKASKRGGSSSPKRDDDDDDALMEARRHYSKASVDGNTYELGSHAFVQAEEGKDDYICRIVEMFEGIDGELYFMARWFYRPSDTVISDRFKDMVKLDEKRIFFSKVQNDNNLGCLVKPINIIRLSPDIDSKEKENKIKDYDYYYDMIYLLPHCSFVSIGPDDDVALNGCGSTTAELTMLDLYAGCGGMSTGLGMGSNSNDAKLVTKWALDLSKDACSSLKLNHPETEVFWLDADSFLKYIKEWHQICSSFGFVDGVPHPKINSLMMDDESGKDAVDEEADEDEIYEVEAVLEMRYGKPKTKEEGLHFKIKWLGYGPEEDSWEPIECLSGCPDKLKEFVEKCYKEKLLPLPGSVDVVCGGPPCQGISGFNRFRNSQFPLKDKKNQQIFVFMDIVEFLRPRFVLMENVVDLFRFAEAYLGRYAYARLVNMQYQARFGIMAAGAYGLAQFRMRAFMWAALASESLPQFPLPTHDVVERGNVPKEFEDCFVAYEEGKKPKLKNKLYLGDIINDLPKVGNDEVRDEMDYDKELVATTAFQKMIRKKKEEMPGFLNFSSGTSKPHRLYDHRPLRLNVDDYTRVCRIPKRKGANFRNLPGLIVIDNKVSRDLSVEQERLPSGKFLVPEYAIKFVRGTSSKPFGRLWYDETVSTVVTRAEPHNQVILHPEQDRVLTIRENARLQGFPDFYQLRGPVKQRYIQIGNAVAVPVGRALGHSLSLAVKGQTSANPVFELPESYLHPIEGNQDI